MKTTALILCLAFFASSASMAEDDGILLPDRKSTLNPAVEPAEDGLSGDSSASGAVQLDKSGLESFSTDDLEKRDGFIDELLAQLQETANAEEAAIFEAAIEDLRLASGSPTVDLLMERGNAALARGDLDHAFFYFNEVASMAPRYAEGWNKRSAVNYLLEDYSAAMLDLERVLMLEPNHFEALAGLAVMMEEIGDPATSLELLRRAQALNPHLERIEERIKRLSLEVEGRGI